MSFYNQIDELQTISNGRKWTRVHAFDFDGTLFKSPMPNAQIWEKDLLGFLANELWYSNLRTLCPPCVAQPVDESWFDKDMLQLARQSIADPDVLAVLMTGRRLAHGFHERIQQCMDAVGLQFDLFFCREEDTASPARWENTIGFKTNVLGYIIDTCCASVVEQVIVWDDRKSQVNGFKSYLEKRMADWRKTAKAERGPEIKSFECIEWHQDLLCFKCMPEDVEIALVADMIAEKRKTDPDINIQEFLSFTGIVLDESSRERILERYWTSIAESDVKVDRRKWSLQNDHVTLFIGAASVEEQQQLLEKAGGLNTKHTLRVVAISPPTAPLLAVKVEALEGTLETMNQHPHVTIATAPGVQAKTSNAIHDWIPLASQDQITIDGIVKERRKCMLVKPPKLHNDQTPQPVSLGGLVLQHSHLPLGPQIGRVVSQIKAWMTLSSLTNTRDNALAIEALVKKWCDWERMLQAYLNAYNNKDLNKVAELLADDCQVFMNAELVTRDKTSLLPTCHQDWQHPEFGQARITQGPSFYEHEGRVGLFVKVSQPWIKRLVHVAYLFRDNKMNRHVITKVECIE